ncbi:hypothetical protein EUX98_g5702 [Antrodiella citrinella]|uniref:L-tryptophan decarboxylase PsiD-like domain-containing protein n=1 Tax=Antrodiella citrinella TaxID=2447956 RepID=A0A4S4MQT4_9APHY|nr:hypothetical protein EUX98_g5702 [Antrodiella citrinella]
MAHHFQLDNHIRGHWLPRNHADIKPWIDRRLKKAHERKGEGYVHHVIQEFQDLIERDADIYLGFTQMFAALPSGSPVTDYKVMLTLFDVILGEAPQFEESTVVAIPITAILLGPMNTQAGYLMFSNDRVNAIIKKMLGVWCKFLVSSASRSVLTEDANGWFGPAASGAIPNFNQTFVCDPDAPYRGFTSWDDFFVRLFRPGVRTIEFPEDTSLVNSACEVTVFRLQRNVQARDQFWIKGHPYSLLQMLHSDELAPQFIGGTVWQAFLSALNYHRWHAPVDGRVVKTVMVPGTYYLQAIDALEVNQTYTPHTKLGETPGPAPDLLDRSQDFITQLAARCLIFIESDNPAIGLMCFIGVGMVEVSTCEITVKVGDRVKKGDEIGMFHFGGSTSCLVFRMDTNITFSSDYPVGAKVPVHAAIAKVE